MRRTAYGRLTANGSLRIVRTCFRSRNPNPEFPVFKHPLRLCTCFTEHVRHTGQLIVARTAVHVNIPQHEHSDYECHHQRYGKHNMPKLCPPPMFFGLLRIAVRIPNRVLQQNMLFGLSHCAFQILPHLCCRAVSLLSFFCRCFKHNIAYSRRYCRIKFCRCGNGIVYMPQCNLHGIFPFVRRFPHKHFKKHYSHGIYIAFRSDFLALRLFRGNIMDRTHNVFPVERFCCCIGILGNAEICEFYLSRC